MLNILLNCAIFLKKNTLYTCVVKEVWSFCMTNPYSMGQPYPQNYQNNIYPQNYYQSSNNSIFSPVLTNSAIGFAGGSIIGACIEYIKNRRPVKNGEVTDSFAKQVMNKMIDKKCTVRGKEFFKQKGELLKKVDKISSPEEFTKLMKKYKTYASSLCDGISLDSMCKTVTIDNLKGKISALKKRIEASLEPEMRNIKDTINLCWDNENKKFVKPKNVEDKIFNIIKNTKNNIQWKKMLKYGGVTASVFGAITLLYSMLITKNQ